LERDLENKLVSKCAAKHSLERALQQQTEQTSSNRCAATKSRSGGGKKSNIQGKCYKMTFMVFAGTFYLASLYRENFIRHFF
jgi:hypothetical protein